MKNGTCPKCGQTTVYKMEDGVGTRECHTVKRGGMGRGNSTFDTYLCTSCGYFENYVKNKADLEEVVKSGKWEKIGAVGN